MAVLLVPDLTDLEVRSELDLADFKPAYLENLLRQAVDRITTRWGARVSARLASGALSEELFKDVVSRSVMRVLRNPAGFTSEQEGNYQYSTRAQVASGYLWFTDDDVIDLLGVVSNTMIGTHRIGLYGGA